MMKWQEVILYKFKDIDKTSILVVDKDNLMQDDFLISELQQQRFDILNFSKEVTFRNEFERSYRSNWDNGLRTQTVIIVQSKQETEEVPYDLYEKSEEIEINLQQIFPFLNYLVVKSLDKDYYQRLFIAHKKLMDQNEDINTSAKKTASFILRSVFLFDTAAIHNEEKLIRLLIEKHYSGMEMPEELRDQIIDEISSTISLDWEIVDAFNNSAYFFNWLQLTWDKYVEDILKMESYLNPDVDFTSNELKLVTDNLFVEKKLKRYKVNLEQYNKILENNKLGLVSVGIELPTVSSTRINEEYNIDLYSINTKFNYFRTLGNEISLRQWLNIGYEFGQLNNNVTSLPIDIYKKIQTDFEKIRDHLNELFINFVKKSYSTISFFDDNKGPINLAKVNNYINMYRKQRDKTVLIVLDGMAIDQWFILRDYLSKKVNLNFNENKTFAIAPTITSISRQSLFSGKMPIHFEDSLFTTNNEPKRWRDYWINKGIRKKRVEYLNVKLTDDLGIIREIADSKNEVLGLVINFIDDLMHSAKDIKEGKQFFYDTIKSYLEHSNLDELIKILINHGYKIYITSDHGNIAGYGNGKKVSKDLTEKYAKRVVIFDREQLGREFCSNETEFIYKTNFLPENFYPVYTTDYSLYDKKGNNEISHGGISIEELIVPFIEVEKANDDRL